MLEAGTLLFRSIIVCCLMSEVHSRSFAMRPSPGDLEFRIDPLLHSFKTNNGPVAVKYKGVWGQVCSFGWYSSDADEVCRRLGYPKGTYYTYRPEENPKYLWGDCNWGKRRNCDVGYWDKDGYRNNYLCYTIAGVSCSQTVVNLRDGEKFGQGTVLVSVNNTFVPVCGTDFGQEEAAVVCRTLGYYETYNESVAYTTSERPQNVASGNMVEYSCQGDERDISACQMNITSCPGQHYAAVQCMHTPIRFANGSDTLGRVEVKLGGQWGSVCNNDWFTNFFQTICKTLGFNSSRSQVYSYASQRFGDGDKPITIAPFSCAADDISACPFQEMLYTTVNCPHNNSLALHCANTEIRLAGGNGSYEGRLEVKYNGKFGSVCSDGFDQTAARLVCKMLGFVFPNDTNIEIFNSLKFGAGNGSIWLDNLHCTGSEKDIAECAHSGWGVTDCYHYEDVALRCPHIPVRLNPTWNGPWQGMVEVYHKGQWGRIGRPYFLADDYDTATAVCRSLGYDPKLLNKGSVKVVNLEYYISRRYVWAPHLRCDATDTDIGMCHQISWKPRLNYSNIYANLAVSCPRPGGPTPIRIVNGSPWTGQVQIYTGTNWTFICDDWRSTEARVVCRMLNFTGGRWKISPVSSTKYSVMMGRVKCNGYEADIGDCVYHRLNSSTCYEQGTASVTCDTPPAPHVDQIRLVGGQYPWMGKVEIFAGGMWGSICKQTFTKLEAKVICRHLGINNKHVIVDNGDLYANATGPIIIPALKCYGSESDLNQCTVEPTELRNNCTHHDDVGVRCSPYTISDTITTSCHKGQWDIQVNMKLLRAMQLNPIASHISLGRVNCVGILSDDTLKFNQSLTECNSQKLFNGTTKVYHNRLAYIQGQTNDTLSHLTLWKVEVICMATPLTTTTTTTTPTTTITTTGHFVVTPSPIFMQVSYVTSSNPATQVFGNPIKVPGGNTVTVDVSPGQSQPKIVLKNCTVVSLEGGSSSGIPRVLLQNGCEVDSSIKMVRMMNKETKFMFTTSWYTGTQTLQVSCKARATCSHSDRSQECRHGCHSGIIG